MGLHESYSLLTSMIVAAEFAVVLVIVVITEKLSSSFQTDDFKYIKIAWWINLVYVLITLIFLFYETVNPDDAKYEFWLIEIISFFDISQFAFLYYALVKTKYEYPNKHFVIRIGLFWFIIGAIVFFISLLWDMNKINLFPYANVHLIPNILFNIFALYLSALFFKSIFISYKVPFKTIYWGTLMYAFIQIAVVPEFPAEYKKLTLMIGWSVGLISKCMICWGLLLIFKAEASRSRRLEKILGNIFHELKNTIYGIDAPVKRILYVKDAKPKSEAQEIGRTYETMASIIEATWLMYKKELDDVQGDEAIELNISKLITANKQNVRLNSLVEIAIKMAKNFTGKKVKFYSDYGGECEILCFRHEIIQILVNLFKNSFEAFSNGIGNIYIITRNKYYLKDKTGKDVEIKCVNIEITDDGPGIPVEIQNKVFELEYTTKKEKGGSGRGLSLVKELIDSSYGKIVLESPVKDHPDIPINGTKFKIFFEK